jgi:hypothetical protein
LEQAQEHAFKLLQRHQRVHIESLSPAPVHYWRYEPHSQAWIEVRPASISSADF